MRAASSAIRLPSLSASAGAGGGLHGRAFGLVPRGCDGRRRGRSGGDGGGVSRHACIVTCCFSRACTARWARGRLPEDENDRPGARRRPSAPTDGLRAVPGALPDPNRPTPARAVKGKMHAGAKNVSPSRRADPDWTRPASEHVPHDGRRPATGRRRRSPAPSIRLANLRDSAHPGDGGDRARDGHVDGRDPARHRIEEEPAGGATALAATPTVAASAADLSPSGRSRGNAGRGVGAGPRAPQHAEGPAEVQPLAPPPRRRVRRRCRSPPPPVPGRAGGASGSGRPPPRPHHPLDVRRPLRERHVEQRLLARQGTAPVSRLIATLARISGV